jgi:hypothetical protein
LFGTAAVVLRLGRRCVTLRDGKSFLATVDDAATEEALVNDLITGSP